ncbi:MAG: hypothetical protein KDC57_14950, partial [Saprospiraceae bacterium]|nr:hypothetical protein [Saprospiraceae bacterium]
CWAADRCRAVAQRNVTACGSRGGTGLFRNVSEVLILPGSLASAKACGKAHFMFGVGFSGLTGILQVGMTHVSFIIIQPNPLLSKLTGPFYLRIDYYCQ